MVNTNIKFKKKQFIQGSCLEVLVISLKHFDSDQSVFIQDCSVQVYVKNFSCFPHLQKLLQKYGLYLQYFDYLIM